MLTVFKFNNLLQIITHCLDIIPLLSLKYELFTCLVYWHSFGEKTNTMLIVSFVGLQLAGVSAENCESQYLLSPITK